MRFRRAEIPRDDGREEVPWEEGREEVRDGEAGRLVSKSGAGFVQARPCFELIKHVWNVGGSVV